MGIAARGRVGGLGSGLWKSPVVAVAVAGATIAFSVLLTGALVQWRAREFEAWHNVRTNFAFAPSSYPLWLTLAFVVFGATAFYSRKWLALGFAGLALSLVAMPVLVWSGPGDQLNGIMPLVNFRMAMWISGWLLNVLFLVVLSRLSWFRAPRQGEGF